MTPTEEAEHYLSDRGVLEDTAKEFQVETIYRPTSEQLSAWIGHDGYSLEAAIVFPNLAVDADTATVSVHNHYIRCFPPPVGNDGKERKFLSTLASTYRPYILPPVLDHACDTSQPIYIVEKQTAALLFEQNGLMAIAFDGTWGAAAKRDNGEPVRLHPILGEFDWIGRPVYLCFDGDFRARTSVLQGLIRAYILFSVAGAVVRLLQWDSALKGVDDYISAKAGLDQAKQRTELDTLTATVSGLSASQAAGQWIIPQYRTLFEREIATIVPGIAERSQLAECIHEALETTAGDLKKSWGIAAKEQARERKDSGPAYPIPDPWPEPVVASEVMFEVLGEFLNHQFVVISPEQAVVCAVHCLTTYLTEYLDDWLHFLYITAGAKESGKTKLLRLFYELCYHAILFGDPTSAAIYYTLQEGVYTILIDEADKNEEHKRAILDLINFSTDRDTAWVSRADPDAKKCRNYPTFCPKILAGIGQLRGTTESRCIQIHMLKKPAGGPRIRIKKEDKHRFAEHRSKMMRIAAEIGPRMVDYDIDLLTLPKGLSDREADNWTLAFLTARMVGGRWPGMLFHAYRILCPPLSANETETVDATELGEALVRDIALIWAETPAQEFYATEDLRRKLIAIPDRPWRNLRHGAGVSAEKVTALLRAFNRRPVQHPIKKQGRGYFLSDLTLLFQSYASYIWRPPEDPGGTPKPTPNPPPTPSGSGEGSPTSPTEDEPAPPADLPQNEEKKENIPSDPHSTPERIFFNSIPPSTPKALFCIATHPERFVCLDLETFYPYTGDFPQPPTFTAGQLATREREAKAHPYASDPRRCALRLLTIHDSVGTFGPTPLTIDFSETPNLPPEVLRALAESTLVGHNLDFDLTVLRRYGIPVSNQVIDTMIASRLLGLGKQKLSFDPTAYAELSLDEVEEMEAEAEAIDPNPIAHDLAAVVRRYLGTRMDKTWTKLGASDWGRKDLSSEQHTYATEDVALLLTLWEAIAQELDKAELRTVFAARMEFFPHLNQIKMTGIPIDTQQLTEEDLPRATTEKEKSAEELTTRIFPELSFEIPKSRKKKIKIKNEGEKTKWIAGPTHEGFRPSCRNQHWLPALASHGIFLENTQVPTLRRADKPECRALLKYAAAAKRLSEIVGISRSIFPDGRVRAETWNQLAAVTGRIISRGPNLQQVPNEYRGPFKVNDPWVWLKGDLEQIEMLILAVVTQDPNLLAMLLSGKDAYVEYGARIFNKKAKRGPGEDQVSDKLRKIAKIPTLGTSYGMTPYGFVRQIRDELGIEYSIEEAQRFFEVFFNMFPGIAAYHHKAEEEAAWRTDVRTIAGTRRWLPALVGEPSEDWELNKEYERSSRYRKNVLLNTPIQGSGADLVIWAVNQFMPQLPSEVQVVNLVHDEVDLLVTKETLHRTVKLITTAFKETFAKFYPQSPLLPSIKFSVGPSWGELQPVEDYARTKERILQ